MQMMRTRSVFVRRRVGAVALALSAAGCDGLLKVSNPGSLDEGQLTNPLLEQFVINGAIGEFQLAYVTYAFWSGVLADEVYTDHSNNTNFRELSLHHFDDLNATNDSVYRGLQRARQSADDATGLLRTMLGDKAASSLNVARALIYAGYSYVLLGEGFCEAPVSLSAGLPSSELLTRAVARFDEGITVATAAIGANAPAAQDLISFAQLGAARASLKKGDRDRARAYAENVRDTFERWAYYSANSPRENNALEIAVRPAAGVWLGMHPRFQGLNDARVSQPNTTRSSLASNPIFTPLKPSMYSGWTASTSAPIEMSTHIKFASGLEARYIVVEADGPNAAMLTFVNARRAVGGKAPVDLSDSALIAEFRVQRARDFYLTGQRLGDLRRYLAAGTDLFPTGAFPVGSASYGTMHCFIVPRSEKSGNPNY